MIIYVTKDLVIELSEGTIICKANNNISIIQRYEIFHKASATACNILHVNHTQHTLSKEEIV